MTNRVTRFAPSPTGYLHLGHAKAALFAAQAANGGRFLLRMEDIDHTRCRPEFDAAILEDMAWLGLQWEQPVRRQSEHMKDYAAALESLRRRDLVYACFCTRADIQREIANADHAPHGPDGPIYPGTCRHLSQAEITQRMDAGQTFALRLRTTEAMHDAGRLVWRDAAKGEQIATPDIFGDVVLARKDTPTSYHLACTWDDAQQGVTLVTRGEDLFAATHVHRLLQHLLSLSVPNYHHHSLLVDADGKKFSKRDQAPTLRALRAEGRTAADVMRALGLG